jgi:hypothetical protein
MRPEFWSCWCVVGLAALGACQRDLGAWHARLASPEVRRLAGSWQLDLSAIAMKPDSTPHTTGLIALTLNDERLAAPGFGSPPVYFGTYDIDFAPLGFSVGVVSGIPSVVATFVGDSIVLILAPTSQAAATLRGLVLGDSIAGRWSMHHRAGVDAVGDFILRRR